MTDVCLDTSVLVKWFYPEDDFDKALHLLQLNEKYSTNLVIPDIVSIELTNSLLVSKGFDPIDAINAIKKLFSLEPHFVSIDEKLLERTILISHKHKLTTYDSLFIVLSELKNIPLFTADYKHHKKSLSKNIIWLKEWKGKL